jgi:hypothetical protein
MEGAGSLMATARVESLEASFARACEAGGGEVHEEYVVGGSPVSLRFASRESRDRLTPAFAHLAARNDPSGTRGLTVHLWDSSSTGMEPPPRPPVPRDEAAGALYHLHEPPLRGAYQAAVNALSVFDNEAGVAWYWVASAADLPSWEQACPIRQILHWWLGSRGYLQVHGAAVGTAGAGALVIGPAGSGKSTVALACLGSDLLYAGDDYVAVALEPSPRVVSLYSSGKLDTPHLCECLPQLLPFVANGDRLGEEKAVLFAQQHFPNQTTPGFPLSALLLPRPGATGGKARLTSVSRAAAFTALGPSTMFQLHTAGASELQTISSLVGHVPSYSLELGSDLSGVPEAISELLSTL